MKYYEYAQNNFATKVWLLLAVIFITACGVAPQSFSPTKIAATDIPTHTPISVSVSPTPTASPSLPQTPLSPTSTSVSRFDKPATRQVEELVLSTVEGPVSSTPSIAENLNNAKGPVLSEGKGATQAQFIPTQQAAKPLRTTPSAMTKTPPSAGVDIYETTITLPTYPFREYLVEQIDPVYTMPVFYFNRAEYEATEHTPTPIEYTGVVLENPYLRLTFIPELGGRLYSAVVKATGQEVFYQNPVVKPSRYGGLQPYEANWWLATGGMEWSYPTREHGYRFGIPWDYSITQNPNGATITLSDLVPDRVSLEVSVTLPTNSATFTVAPRLVNNGPNSVPIQLWTNAALTLAAGSMSPDTQFIVPTDVITIHSRGESGWTVPDAHHEAPWPQIGDTDLSDYSQWANYLGFFIPNQKTPFLGAYNPAADLGIVRLVAGGNTTSGGSKLFAFGAGFPDRSYTDDNSQYFEIWGGANTGFWPENNILVPVGQTLSWEESWWPMIRLGGLTWATKDVAIYLSQTGNTYTLSALVSRPMQGNLWVLAGDVPILDKPFYANPVAPLQWTFAVTGKPIRIRFTDNNDTTLLEYQVVVEK